MGIQSVILILIDILEFGKVLLETPEVGQAQEEYLRGL